MPTALLGVAVVVAMLMAVASVVAAVFIFGRTSGHLAPEEAGLVPTYSTRGGGVFGLVRVSTPLVRIAVYPHQVVIAALRTYVIPVHAIREVSLERALFGRVVRLVHDSPSVPSRVLLWAKSPDALAAAIRYVAPHAAAAG
jgi:hypothetical protein